MGHIHSGVKARLLARTLLGNGRVVSTLRLPGLKPSFETIVFGPGWPERSTSAELVNRRATTTREALGDHAELVQRFGGMDHADPNWVFRMMGLPARRYPKGCA